MKHLFSVMGVLALLVALLFAVDRGIRAAHQVRRVYIKIDRNAD